MPKIENEIICQYLWRNDKQKMSQLMNPLCEMKEINYITKYCILKLTKKLKEDQSGGENKLASLS